MFDRPFILVSAHHCAPGMGSEHATGWNYISRLANDYSILLVTQDNEYRGDVEKAVADLNKNGACVKPFFVRHGFRTDGRKNSLRIFYYLTYRIYQKKVFILAKKLQENYSITAVHHLTIHGFREPGFLWKLGLPFVWGPVGLAYTPLALFGLLTWKMKIFQLVRNWLTWMQFNFSWRIRSAYLASQFNGTFIAANPDVGIRFTNKFGGRYIWIPETGAGTIVDSKIEFNRGGPLRLLWVGALIDTKPLNLLIEAIANIPHHRENICLTVIGDGEAREKYEHLAQVYGIAASFIGWIPHSDVILKFKNSELLVMLSVKDGTPNVIFEALSSGVPVMCLNHHGYSYIIDNNCGIKLDLQNVKSLKMALTMKIKSLIENRAQLDLMSAYSLAKAKQFSWDNNAREISNIYHELNQNNII